MAKKVVLGNPRVQVLKKLLAVHEVLSLEEATIKARRVP
jgi:hypothetical protein